MSIGETFYVGTLQQLALALGGDVSGDQVLAPGPEHTPPDRSMSVKPDDNAPGGFVVHSFAGDDPIHCRDHVRAKLGLPEWKPREKTNGKSSGTGRPFSLTVAKYVYRTSDNKPNLCVHRLADKSGFPQYHWDGEKWLSGKPQGPKIPYRLPQLLAAPTTAPVYVVEGEKDADNLAKLGCVVTCNSEGADTGTGNKWTADLNEYFKDRHVYIIADNDDKGREHAQHVAHNLDLIAASVRIVQLPGLPPKGDVSDWLCDDPTGARLVRECKLAPLWEPSAAVITGTSGAGDDYTLIDELAALSLLDYAKRRVEAAKGIGIGVIALDRIVDDARIEVRGKPAPETLERWHVEACDEEVATSDLLHALKDMLLAYVIVPLHYAVASALWILHAWALDAAYISPFLMLTSPEMRCGKSKLLTLLYRTCPRTAFASNISSAAIFRYIEANCPTLVIDEADTFAADNEGMRGILNSGHSRDTAHIIRCVGDDNEAREFLTWSAKAIAGIGKLPATLRDRSIILSMKRKRPGERVSKLRTRDGEPFISLRRKAARWVNDNLATLMDAEPDMPGGLNDRAQDNWQPLLAIADLAGGE